MSLWAVLAPDPPRHLPGHRAMSVSLRSAHIVTFSMLVGGHAFAVDPTRLHVFLFATLASGGALVALELVSTFDWLRTVKGLAVVAKILLLCTVPIFWEHRVAILVAVIVLASSVAHMPRRYRHAFVF